MDAWSAEQLKRMQLGGNDTLNNFLKKYGVDKFTDIKEKYNSAGAEVVPSLLSWLQSARQPHFAPRLSYLLPELAGCSQQLVRNSTRDWCMCCTRAYPTRLARLLLLLAIRTEPASEQFAPLLSVTLLGPARSSATSSEQNWRGNRSRCPPLQLQTC